MKMGNPLQPPKNQSRHVLRRKTSFDHDLDRLMNLMLNGVEAMKDMTAPGTLTIMSRRSEDGELPVSILDRVVGVPPEQIDQIFSAFITSKPQGTGMGLPISRSIIESHGGRLWATPNTGPGATFQLVLPIEPSAHQTE